MRILIIVPVLFLVHTFAEPLPSITFQGWENALRVSNGAIEVVAVPEIGRLVSIRPAQGENLLHFRQDLAGQLPPQDRETDWFNYGGDWLWPVHQDRWKDTGGAIWPPIRLLDGRPWTGRAWHVPGKGQGILLEIQYGEPLNLRVSRQVFLPEGTSTVFTVQQKITRTAPSGIPACLWQISQLNGVEKAVLAVSRESRFAEGYRVIAFDTPDKDLLTFCGPVLMYSAGVRGEHKLGTDGSWIAAKKGALTLKLIARGPSGDGLYPDGGCSVLMFSNAGLGYTEIETQSVERFLEPGESMENTVSYHLFPAPTASLDCTNLQGIP
jgi:hypothetical protein